MGKAKMGFLVAAMAAQLGPDLIGRAEKACSGRKRAKPLTQEDLDRNREIARHNAAVEKRREERLARRQKQD